MISRKLAHSVRTPYLEVFLIMFYFRTFLFLQFQNLYVLLYVLLAFAIIAIYYLVCCLDSWFEDFSLEKLYSCF